MLVQRIKAESKTAGGIFLPESAVKELNEAKVLAVGPGGLDKEGKRIQPSVEPGDKVLIPQVRTLSWQDSYGVKSRSIHGLANKCLVRWQSNQGRRRGVLPIPGSRVSTHLRMEHDLLADTVYRLLAKIKD